MICIIFKSLYICALFEHFGTANYVSRWGILFKPLIPCRGVQTDAPIGSGAFFVGDMEQLSLFSDFSPLGELTFSEAIDIDWKLYGQYTRGSRHVKAKYNHLRRFFGTRMVHTLNETDIEAYRRFRASSGVAASTINREHVILTSMFNRLKRWKKLREVQGVKSEGWILPEENPGSLVKKFDERGFARKRVLSRDEFSQFLEHCHQRLHDICVMAILTTFRLRDLKLLSKDSINTSTGRLEITQSKTGKPQTAKITRKIQEIIDRSEGRAILDFTNFEHEFPRVKKKSKIQFQFRDLRRTAARNLLQSGEDIMTVKEVLGHQSVTTTQIYTPPNSVDLERAGEILEKRFC